MKPSIEELLDRAERLAEMAEDEATEDDPAMLLNAAIKGWTAANLSMAAVIDHFTGRRPNGTQTRKKELRTLAEQHEGRAKRREGALWKLSALVGEAYSTLHLRASEQADYNTKSLRSAVRDVASKLVPLAQELCR